MPTIRILHPNDEPTLEAFLQPRLASSMILLSNLRQVGLLDHGEPYQGTYAATFEGDAITGVAAHYWNQNIILQAPPDQVAPLCQAASSAAKRPIGGFIGPAGQVRAAKQAFCTDIPIQMDSVEILYSLDLNDLQEPEGLHTGQVTGRPAAEHDLEMLTQWRVSYCREALGAEETPELYPSTREEIARSIDEGSLWVLEENGQVVASSGFNSRIAEAVQVGGVWTPPNLRRRGYGRAAVAVSLLDARAEGAEQAILFTGEENIAAQKAYLALGFQPIGDYAIVLLKQPINLA